MRDARIQTLARERIEIAVEERWSPLEMQIAAITSEFAKAGRIGSGNLHVRIVELYKDELEIQASLAWGQLRTVLATVGIGSLDHLASDLKAFMDEMIEWITTTLSDRLSQSSHLRVGRPQGTEPLVRFSDGKRHAIRKIHSEIDLLVVGLEQAGAAQRAATHVNIYGGQVGILQTGAFSTASMTVDLDSAKQEIARVLNTVETNLEEATHAPFKHAEILEMIRDSKCELDKPRPNVSRLQALMVGVATSIQTVASLRPAYDVMKGGLALIGVTLP